MAGFREFVTGEVLTAANVNDYLGKQAVMKFADASARDTALGTAVGGSNALREGMVAYLDDTDEVLFYDGSAWGAVGLPLGTATPTDGQYLSFGTATSTWNPVDLALPAGIGSNVVQAGGTLSQTVNTGTYTDLTGVDVTITPTDATSKVLVFAQIGGGLELAGTTKLRFVGTSGGNSSVLVESYVSHSRHDITFFVGWLFSPATTSAVTFKTQATAGGTVFRYRWSMWAIEVAV